MDPSKETDACRVDINDPTEATVVCERERLFVISHDEPAAHRRASVTKAQMMSISLKR